MKKKKIFRALPLMMAGILCASTALPVSADEGEDAVRLFREDNDFGRAPLSEEQERMFQYPELPAVSTNALFPEKFDLREEGDVTPVRDQGIWNTCWTFGILSAAEGNLLREYDIETDLSEHHLAWFTWQPETSGSQAGEGISVTGHPLMYGGHMYYSTATLSAWKGAALEEDIPYTDSDGEAYNPDGDWSVDESRRYDSSYQLRNINFLPNPTVITDTGEYLYRPQATEIIKSALMETGVLDAGYYMDGSRPEYATEDYFNYDTGAQYADQHKEANHEVSIVGWDDTYPAENFKIRPEGDGAWIVKNSWGTGWGSGVGGNWGGEGYFYMSYYDRSLCDVNQVSVVPEEQGNDHNYQYDYLGTASWWNFYNDDGSLRREANIFEVQGNEQISAVSAATNEANMTVTVDIYKLGPEADSPEDGQKAASQEVFFPYTGYHVIELEEPVMLRAGEKFAVVLTKTGTDGLTWTSVEAGYEYSVAGMTYTSKINEGESYIFLNGKWEDMITAKESMEKEMEESFGRQVEVGNVLIKAFTDEIPAAELTSLKIEGFDANGQPAGEGLEVGPSETQITIPADMEYVSFEAAVQPDGGTAEIKVGDRVIQPGEKISRMELKGAEITVTTAVPGGIGNTYTFTVDVSDTAPSGGNGEDGKDDGQASGSPNGENTPVQNTKTVQHVKTAPKTGDSQGMMTAVYAAGLLISAFAAAAAIRRKRR